MKQNVNLEDFALVGTPVLLKVPTWMEVLSPMLKDLSNLAALGVALFAMAHYVTKMILNFQQKRINALRIKRMEEGVDTPDPEDDKDD